MKYTLLVVFIAVVAGAGMWFYANGNNLAQVQWLGQNPPNSAEGAPEGSIHNLPVPAGVAAARARAAQDGGVAESQVLIETAFESEWSDGCLGLGGPAESCIQMITPGYEVTVMVRGQVHVYRTNTDGSVVRKES